MDLANGVLHPAVRGNEALKRRVHFGQTLGAVAEFLGSFALSTALMLLAALPLILLTRRRQPEKGRRFVLGAFVAGFLCGVITATSDEFVARCRAAGNPQCVDYGSSGMFWMIVGGYAVVALLNAYLVWRD